MPQFGLRSRCSHCRLRSSIDRQRYFTRLVMAGLEGRRTKQHPRIKSGASGERLVPPSWSILLSAVATKDGEAKFSHLTLLSSFPRCHEIIMEDPERRRLGVDRKIIASIPSTKACRNGDVCMLSAHLPLWQLVGIIHHPICTTSRILTVN